MIPQPRVSAVQRWLFAALVAASLAATYYYHFVKKEDILFSHLFYLPIVIAGLWWGARAVWVSLFLAGVLVISQLVADFELPLYPSLLRGLMFIVVGAVLGLSVEQRRRLELEALEEHAGNIAQMKAHVDYVERVAHELRNPLQVSLGALDSLDASALPERQRALVKMLNRSADEIAVRIKRLTPDGKD